MECCISSLQQANQLENGKGQVHGKEAGNKEGEGKGKGKAERPHSMREMMKVCQSDEHGSDGDSASMEV